MIGYAVMGLLKSCLCVTVSVKIMGYGRLFVCVYVSMYVFNKRVYYTLSR